MRRSRAFRICNGQSEIQRRVAPTSAANSDSRWMLSQFDMSLHQFQICDPSSAIKRSVAPAGKQENVAIRREFGLPADKAFKG